MTLSTYHLPVIFPDEAVVLNYKGVQPPRNPKYHLADYLQSPEGESGRVHKSWGDDARMKAMESIANNYRKDKILRGHIPSTITTNRKDSKKPLYRSPEYLDTRGTQLYGGVVTTREGQQLLADKLQQRIQSLNELDASAWGSPVKETSGVLPPVSSLETQPLDDAFVSLADAIQSGYISPTLLDALNRSNSAIVQVGPYLQPTQIAEYIRINDSLTQAVLGMEDVAVSTGPTGVGAETKRILKALQSGLARQRSLLEDLNKKAFYSVPDKKLLLESSRKTMLPTAISRTRASQGVYGLSEAARSGDPLREAVARRRIRAIRNPPPAVSRETLPVGVQEDRVPILPVYQP